MKKPILPTAPLSTVSVQLDTPLVRGEQTIHTLVLRRPKSGELFGVNLSELVQLNVGALVKVLPRITEPTLTTHDVQNLELPDLLSLGSEIVGFLLPSEAKASLSM